MKVDEVSFWLQWYSAWEAEIAAGAGSVELSIDANHSFAGFEESVLRLDVLVARAGTAPVPKSYEHQYGTPEGEQEADVSDEGTDWPAPGVPLAAAAELRSLVREPWDFYAGGPDPSQWCFSNRCGFDRLVAGARGVVLLRATDDFAGSEHTQAIEDLRTAIVACMFSPAIDCIDFLSRTRVAETLARSGLGVDAMTPFHRFIDVDLTLRRFVDSASTRALRWDDYDDRDYYKPPSVCPHCDAEFPADNDHDPAFCDGSGNDFADSYE